MNITIELPENVHRYIEAQAQSHGHSITEEAKWLLTSLSEADKKRGETAWENLKLLRQKMLAERGGIPFPDSTPLIRESREHDH